MPVVLLSSSADRIYTLTVAQVVSKVRDILQDKVTPYRTEDSEFIGLINDAVNTVLGAIPSLFAEDLTHTCRAGYDQAVTSARAVAMLDIVGVLECDMASLTQFSPGWKTATPGGIQNWMRVAGAPLAFYCYPPASEGQALTLRVVISPQPVDALDDTLPLPENFEAALVEYVAGMHQLKEDESIDFQRQQALLASFTARIKGA